MAYQPKNRRKFLATSLSAAVVASAVAPTAGFAAENEFPDVPQDHNYYEVITALSEAGVVAGMTDGTFNLGGELTRAEASQMVSKILKLDTDASNTPFADVKEDVWYTDAINALYAEGHIKGLDEDTFAPNKVMTRAELAQLIVEAYDIPAKDADLPFEDVKEDVWYTDAITTLYAHGLISGQNATEFGPNDVIKRGDFAWLLANTDYAFGDTLEKPEAPETTVETVSAINASEVLVTFNQDVDVTSAEKAANYELKVNDVDVTIKDIEVDGNEAILLLDDTSYFQAGDKYVIQTNDAITSKGGEKIQKFVSDEQTFDASKAPSLKSVTSDASGLELEFDRPVASDDSNDEDVTLIKVDGVALSSKNLQPVANTDADTDTLDVAGNYKYTVSGLTSDEIEALLEVGTHEVVIYDAKDTAAEYSKVASVLTGEYTVSDDVTAPEVTGIEAINANKFFVYTNTAVDLSNAKLIVEKGNHEFTTDSTLTTDNPVTADSTVDAVAGTYKNKTGVYVIVTEDNDGTVDENPLYKNGETSVNLKVTLENYKADGLIGKKSVETVTLEKNDSKPVVKETAINGTDLEVTFEDNLAGSLSPSDVVVRDKDGVIKSVSSISLSMDTVTVTLSDVDDEPYTVEFKANKFAYAENDSSVSGYIVNTLKNDKLTATVESSESNFKYTEFDLTSASSLPSNNVIEIDYGKEMSESARQESNYKLDGKALPAGSTVDFFNDKETVRITLPKGTLKASTQYKLSVSTDVTTAVGSHIVGSLQTKAAAETVISLADNVAPELKSAKYLRADEEVKSTTTSDQIEITFTEELLAVADTTESQNDFKVVVNGTTIGVNAVTDGTPEDEKLVLTLAQEINVSQAATISIIAEGAQTGDKAIVIKDLASNKAKAAQEVSATTSKYSTAYATEKAQAK
jgi:uncharacterized repeat protein (TIGR02059 family)